LFVGHLSGVPVSVLPMPVSQVPVWSFARPSQTVIDAFVASQRDQPFSYREVNQTKGAPPFDYRYDDNQVEIGSGDAVFRRACEALNQWKMFPAPWTKITPDDPATIRPGLVVAMLAQGYGLWWLNACRVVYVVNEAKPVRVFGFAYGTLAAHVEQGEELFTIEQWADGTVWYRVQAFSRPSYWPVRLARPWARRLQRKFLRDSQAAMRQLGQTPA